MASSYHSKFGSTQSMGVPFSLFWVMGFSIIFLHFGKGQVFSDDSNLTNLVDVQPLHENGK